MSFTTEIKQEIAYNDLKDCCQKAELSALIQLTSSLSISNRQLELLVRCENPTTAKRIIALIKKSYPIETELEIAKKTNLKKNNIYSVLIKEDARVILEDLGLYSSKGLLNHPSFKVVEKECCARAYIAGCFLAYGSCNAPSTTNYHLEISLTSEEHAKFILKLLNRFVDAGKVSKRRNKYIVYIKKADAISDFLRLVGANESCLNFENTRIHRDLKNSFVRLDNCEIANEVKTLSAAKKQMDAIKIIKEKNKYPFLDEKIRNVIDVRQEYQDYSLLELCDAYQKKYGETISKSGMKHRLNKVEEIAAKL